MTRVMFRRLGAKRPSFSPPSPCWTTLARHWPQTTSETEAGLKPFFAFAASLPAGLDLAGHGDQCRWAARRDRCWPPGPELHKRADLLLANARRVGQLGKRRAQADPPRCGPERPGAAGDRWAGPSRPGASSGGRHIASESRIFRRLSNRLITCSSSTDADLLNFIASSLSIRACDY